MPARPVLLIALSTVAASAALAGCADLARVSRLAPAGVDPNSPVAAQVQAVASRDYPYPRFRDVPTRPTDVRPAEQWKAAVAGSIQDRRGLRGWWAENPAMVGDTEGFAVASRAQIPAEVLKPLDAMSAESTEAYAERLRRLAAAPAALPRGPAPQPLPPPGPSRP